MPGSELVFTYLERRFLESTDREIVALRETFASVGEPWVCGFDPAQLGDDLRAAGLLLVEDLGEQEQRERYCADREDSLAPSPGEHIARAQVLGLTAVDRATAGSTVMALLGTGRRTPRPASASGVI